MYFARAQIASVSNTRSLIKGALGKIKADLVVRNGSLVNVYSGEILDGYSVAIKGEKIVYVGKDASHAVGERTEVIEASGKVITPGFIDGHFHFTALSPRSFIKHAAITGTTTLIVELDLAEVAGYHGALSLLRNFRNQPINLFGLAPSRCIPKYLGRRPLISQRDNTALLKRQDVIALGETLWTDVIDHNDAIGYISQAQAAGKRVEGHGSGAHGTKLVAFAASGVSSCHESVNVNEAIDRVRLGMYVMIRDGSVRQDLQIAVKLKEKGIDSRRLILVTDGLSPEHITGSGCLNHVVQKAINLGLPPIEAIQMVTLNVAEHFGLDSIVGGIAPGRYADMLILPSISEMQPQYVVCRGNVISKDGNLRVPPAESRYPKSITESVRIGREMREQDFNVPAPVTTGRVQVRVVELISNVITREQRVSLNVKNGLVMLDPTRDVVKCSVIDRKAGNGRVVNGFVRGFGLKAGAFACCSSGWGPNSCVVVVGADGKDMALAVNRLVQLQGGFVVTEGQDVRAELPMPIAGFLTDDPAEKVAAAFRNVTEDLRNLGCTIADPCLALQTLPSPYMPFFRISTHGLLDLRKREIVELVV